MAEYTLSNAAGVIDSAITRVASANTTPTANSQAMVTSGGVKAYVDGKIQGVGSDTSAIEADLLALETTVNGLFPTAVLTLPTTTYSVSSNVTGWSVADPNNLLTYTASNGSWRVNTSIPANAGVYATTLKMTVSDSDGGSDRFDFYVYNPDEGTGTQGSMLFNLNNLNNTYLTHSGFILNSSTAKYAYFMHEANANTTTTLTNFTVTVTKIA